MAEKIPDTIPQIGPATLALLRQRGIETNLDVLYTNFPSKTRPYGETEDRASLKRIPGLGPGREALLREWAQRVYLTQTEKDELASHERLLATIRAEDARRNAENRAKFHQEAEKRRAEEAQRAAVEKARRKGIADREIAWKTDAKRRKLIWWNSTGWLLSAFLGANKSDSVGSVVLLVWLLTLGYYFFYKQQWMSRYSSSRRTQEISVNGAEAELSVILKQAGGKKIQVTKVVRELTGLGLKEATDLVDGAPNAVKRNVSKDEAAQIKAKLEAEGAVVEVR
jgi:hypothetical protein